MGIALSPALLTPSLLLEATSLHHQLADLLERARDQRWNSRRLLGKLGFRVAGIAGASDVTPTRTSILRFLDEHRGKAFCSRCIAAQAFDGRNIDVAMRRLEGHPSVSRHHGQCATCGKMRLVTTLI